MSSTSQPACIGSAEELLQFFQRRDDGTGFGTAILQSQLHQDG